MQEFDSVIKSFLDKQNKKEDLIIDHLEKISAGLEIKILRDKNVGEGQYFSYPKSLEVQNFLALMPLVEARDNTEIFS